MPKPASTPRWGDNLADPGDIVEPLSGKKDIGWQDGEMPPHSYMNWLFNLIWQWTVYLDGLTDEALTWTAAHIFQAGITVTRSTSGTAVTATGNGSGAGVFGTGGASGTGVSGSASGAGAAGVFGSSSAGYGVRGAGDLGGGYFQGTGSAAAVWGSAVGTGKGGLFEGAAGSSSVGRDGAQGTGGIGHGASNAGGKGLLGQGGAGAAAGSPGGLGVEGLGGDATGTVFAGGYGVRGFGGAAGSSGTGGGGLLGEGHNQSTGTQKGGYGVTGYGGYSASGQDGGVGGFFKGGADTAGGLLGDGVQCEGGTGAGSTHGAAMRATHGDVLIEDGSIDQASAGDTGINSLRDTQITGDLEVTDDLIVGDTLGVTGAATFDGAITPNGGIVIEAEHTVGGGGEPAFAGSWVNQDAVYKALHFWIDAQGQKSIQGYIKSGTGTVFTLPSAYWPSDDLVFPGVYIKDGAPAACLWSISPAGVVALAADAGGSVKDQYSISLHFR